MSSKAEFLGTLPIFKDLDLDQLETLAGIAPEYDFPANAIIAYQRDVANSLYIVRQGRLFASTVDAQGRVRDARAYEAGSCFEEMWLLDRRVHPATVRATDPGRLIIIDGPAFIHLLDKNPDIVDALEPFYNEDDEYISGLSEEAWSELEKSRLGDVEREFKSAAIGPDELVEYWTRRSRWLLWLRIAFRTIVLIIWLAGYLLMSNYFSVFNNAWFALFFLVIPAFVLTFLILYEYIDWRNDYLIITNKQVLHYEFHLSLRQFGTRVQKTPFDQIQSVGTVQPSFLAKLLNLGTVRITSASASVGGTIVFDFISDPRAAKDAVNNVQGRARELDSGEQQALIRRTLATHFAIAEPYEAVEVEQEPESSGVGIFGWLRRRFATRLEVGDEVTYRKSRVFLIWELRWAFLLALGLTIAGRFMLSSQVSSLFWLIWGVAALVDAFVFVWQVEDWRNDQYKVNNRYVLDIDRKPFGFGESRKQAELENIQNVSSLQPGLLANIFRYGNVSIETAGVAADIVFERVTMPDLVQQDIFKRREVLRNLKRQAEGAQRRDEYAVLLDVYQQINEQGQIPRRTPTINVEEE